MIVGVHVKKLKVITDERGFLMEILRSDDSFFKKFGQVYLSVCNPGYMKGWHYHKKQTDNFAVVYGRGKVVLYDGRESSDSHGDVNEFVIGKDNPLLITIPPGVLHGVECVGDEPCYVFNCPTEPYKYDEPDEFRVNPFSNEVPYTWTAKKGH